MHPCDPLQSCAAAPTADGVAEQVKKLLRLLVVTCATLEPPPPEVSGCVQPELRACMASPQRMHQPLTLMPVPTRSVPQRYLFMKLTYHEHTPESYEPVRTCSACCATARIVYTCNYCLHAASAAQAARTGLPLAQR